MAPSSPDTPVIHVSQPLDRALGWLVAVLGFGLGMAIVLILVLFGKVDSAQTSAADAMRAAGIAQNRAVTATEAAKNARNAANHEHRQVVALKHQVRDLGAVPVTVTFHDTSSGGTTGPRPAPTPTGGNGGHHHKHHSNPGPDPKPTPGPSPTPSPAPDCLLAVTGKCLTAPAVTIPTLGAAWLG